MVYNDKIKGRLSSENILYCSGGIIFVPVTCQGTLSKIE
jgi:hypothetical protein